MATRNGPLTPSLSPSDGERERDRQPSRVAYPADSSVTKRSFGVRVGAEKVAELNGLGKIVHFVAMLPIHPDVFNPDIAVVAGLAQGAEDARIVNGVLLEGGLQPPLASAAGMEVGRVGYQRFGGAVGQTGAGEMGVI